MELGLTFYCYVRYIRYVYREPMAVFSQCITDIFCGWGGEGVFLNVCLHKIINYKILDFYLLYVKK